MEIIIKDINIKNDSYYFNTQNNLKLSGLSKVNIFIGENNSGKSRLLRDIFKSFGSELQFIPQNSEILNKYQNINKSIDSLRKDFESDNDDEIEGPDENQMIMWDLDEINFRTQDFLIENIENFSCIEKLKDTINDLYGNSDSEGSDFNIQDEIFASRLNASFKENFDKEICNNLGIFNYSFKKIYIPILRGLRPFVSYYDPDEENQVDSYKKRTIHDYFKETSIDDEYFEISEETTENNDLTIYTGMNYYKIIQNHLLGDLSQRELIKKFEICLSENFFDDKVALIPKLGDDVLSVKIGNEEEKPIYELGEGVQEIIIILLPLFLHLDDVEENENILFFIEEPEQHLHPTLQKKLIETFNQPEFDKYQFFFTTHSNHFLDLTLTNNNISIFSFRKKLENLSNEETPKFLIERFSSDNYSILDEIGVKPSSVLMSNCNILVEGASDKPYYRKYLKIHMENDENLKKYEEGIHYIFDSYGGTGNIKTKLDIMNDSLNDKIMFIADEDGNRDDIEKKLENAKHKYILNCREVENTLSEETILKIFEMRDDINYEKIDKDFCKEELVEDKYRNEKMAKFLDKCASKTNLFSIGDNNKGKNPNDFRDKVNFAGLAMRNVECWDDLSDEAKSVAKKMYKFIEKKNS
ncbi:hypothetical protein SDC9_08479 [bioreactor metagenome]|uniref:Endonuclease GajA/Old nuclease/RecF-like AAA domain-containing protein n=1 Tax=bioreactor metagenome TaxID=1076179 RepID=A0A644T7W6_9ZZZZ|nr:AAA family ATPase [Methanobrevibacter sp.]MEA4957218.1 AAA family ATPase [Methanobrevibacter sp.]